VLGDAVFEAACASGRAQATQVVDELLQDVD
jgi:hypothetical protein